MISTYLGLLTTPLRRARGDSYGDKKFESQYGNAMDYFQTVGFLVHSGGIQSDFFKNTWVYYSSAYLQAGKVYMDRDRLQDATTYEEVYYSQKKFGDDPAMNIPADLKAFFEDEKNLPE